MCCGYKRITPISLAIRHSTGEKRIQTIVKPEIWEGHNRTVFTVIVSGTTKFKSALQSALKKKTSKLLKSPKD